MMKFPSVSAGGLAPSGNSVAVTYPGVFGSRVGGVGRADGLGMAGPIQRDVRHGTLDAVDDTHGKDAIEVFVTPIVVGGDFGFGHERARALVAPKLAPTLGEGTRDGR